MDGGGLAVLAVGLLLCFFGVRSLNLTVAASGFALGWLLTEPFQVSILTALVIAAAAALLAWVLARFVFRAALFFIGAIAGGVIGAKLFGLLEQGDGNIVVAVLFVAAAAFIIGIATQRFRHTVLVAACALGGAGLALSGLARAFPGALGFLRFPQMSWQVGVAAIAWLALAAAGWTVLQRAHREQDRTR